MKFLTVKDIVRVTDGKLIQGNENLICENFSKDTRTIQKGDIYLGIKGEHFDGNLFWRQAFEKGAECAIISSGAEQEERKGFENKTIIQVEDTLEALYKIAKYKREQYKIPVIAITGSVGKTSTKDMVASVVAQKYKVLKTQGNHNNNIGLPFTILQLKDEEAMVLEMGMNHFGEISLLTHIAQPDICVITNIGTSHIGNLGSRENILKAKLEILEGNENPTIILNNDNVLLHKWAKENKKQKRIYTYGIQETSDINAKDIILKENSSEFSYEDEQEKIVVHVPVGGEHFVFNALCAVCVGKALKMENQEIVKGIEEFELTKKRMDITKLANGIKIINDAYNASLESMKASLKYLASFKGSRKIAVLGEMQELGEYTKTLHEEVGKIVFENKIDLLIVCGEKAKSIVEKAKEMGMAEEKIYYLKNTQEILDCLKKIAEPKDTILLKASNGMRFFELAEKMKTIL